MDISSFIQHYGYIAVLLGCILEGETAAVLGGMAANTGLELPKLYLMAFTGAWLCDSILFLVGHYYGPTILKHLSKYQDRIDKIERIIHKHDMLAIIGLRFLYGLRTIGPMSIGIAGVNSVRFIICNAVGSALWSAIFVTIGYSAGKIFEEQLHKIGTNLLPILIIAVFVFSIFFIIRILISKYTRRSHKTNKSALERK